MKNRWLLVFLVSVLFVAGTSFTLAQAPTPAIGDFGSVASASWDLASTWKLYSTNAAFDSTTLSAPSSSSNVFIQAGTTVTYVTSSQNCKNLVIQSGGKLQSNATLPIAAVYLKINGPTVWVDGTLGSGPTDALSLETKYAGTITIGGSGTINIGQIRPNSSQPAGPLTVVFASNANINYAGTTGTGGAGIYTSRGLCSSVTVTINPGVTVTFSPNSHFELQSSSSAIGNMNTTLNVNGTMTLPASSVILADSVAYACSLNVGATGILNIGKALTPYLTGSGLPVITVASGGQLNILSSGTADFSNASATVNGAGTFAVQTGGTVKIGALTGLDPVTGPLRTATVLFDTSTSFSYLGTGLQSFGSQFPDSVLNLTIGANSIDSVTAAKKVKGILQIDGLLINNGGLTSVGTAVVNGTYQDNTAAGYIPVGTWNTGSMCLLTGSVATGVNGIPGINQNFYNFKVDCPRLSGANRLGFVADTIRGTMTIHNTNDAAGAAANYFAIGQKLVNGGVTVLGNLLIDSTAAGLAMGTGSSPAINFLTVKGNIISSGSLYANGSGITSKIFAYGDVIIQNTNTNSFRGHSATAYADTAFFCGSGVQRFVKPTGLTAMANLSFRVLPGSTVSLDDTTAIVNSGTGVFTVDSAATLKVGHPNGVNGNITGATSLSSGATFEFNGKSAQVTGTKLPATVNNLVVNDSLGVTLSAADSVNGTLTLTKGILTTGAFKVAVGSAGNVARTAGYVSGNLQKTFAATSAKTFEVGTANGYSPVSVNVTVGSGTMLVTAVQGQHPSTFDVTKSLNRYWTLNADPGITMADLMFSYLASDVVGLESKYGAWWYSGSGTTWTALASQNNVTAHTVSAANVTTFNHDWTLGESLLATGVVNQGTIPSVFYVDQNYPNPFNPMTKISFGLPAAAYVTVTVYNMLGQPVSTVLAGDKPAGTYTVEFDGSHLSSGVYFYRVQAGSSIGVKRMVLLK